MRTLILFFGLALITLSACKRELDEPYRGYFFIQNTDSALYTLYLNDELVGDLEDTPEFPIICIDSTLENTTQIAIRFRKNDFVLIDAVGDIVSKGSFKIEDNGPSFNTTSRLGSTYVKIWNDRVVVGFNLEGNPIIDDPARDCD